jgi:replicative DNA helicase
MSKLIKAPFDLDAEAALLATLLLNFKVTTLDIVEQYVSADDFYHQAHQAIFRSIRNLVDTGHSIDLVTLSDDLRNRGELDHAGGMLYLSRLIAVSPNFALVESYAKIVQEYSLRRRLVDFAAFTGVEANDQTKAVYEVLESTEQRIFDISKKRPIKPFKDASSLIKTSMAILEKRKQSKSLYTGIPTEFLDLDGILSGLQDSEMVVIGARPSVGKTALALSIAQNIAVRQKIACGFFSLEMAGSQLMLRLLAAEAKLNSKKLRNPGLLASNDWGALSDAASRLYEAPLYIDDTPNIVLSDLRSQARRMKLKHDIKVLFIDYLGLVTVDDSSIPRYEQMAMVSRNIKSLARELEIPVVILSQLRRDAEGKEPNLADLRETGAIEQDADVVMFLHRERSFEDDSSKDVLETKLIVAKQRNGPTGVINLAFIPKYARYENLG